MRRPESARRRAETVSGLALGASILLGACTGVFAPRFPQDIATALAQEPMSRMETPDVYLFYPTKRHDEAVRFLERVEGCAAYWRNEARIQNQITAGKKIVIMPELPYNNAFVAPQAEGYEAVAIVPTYNTIDFFTIEAGLPPDPAFIGCHEITHYVHFKQIAGFAWFLNTVFGDLYSPQVGLDSWFDEGLAVYSETILQPGVGRLAWPFWNGVFAAGVAGKRINGGDLSVYNRVFEGGNNYLFGSQFVRFLAERYGELKLWRLIEVQGHSIFFPLWIDLRFWQVYDKTLSDLIDEFADATQTRYPPAGRPPGQRPLRDAGTNARYARAPDGTEALVTEDVDRPSRLQIYAPDGRRLIDRDLTDVVPPRDLKISAADITGGLSFSPDGRWLYFAAQDLNVTFQAIRLMRLEVATNRLTTVSSDLRGTGGSISPDGRRYLFARAEGDRHDLAELDLASGSIRTVVAAAPRHYFTTPRYSPDGRKIVATSFDGQRFGIAVLAASDGRRLEQVPLGSGPAMDPSWVDDGRILFLGVTEKSPGFQVYVHELGGATSVAVTHAPFLAFEARAAGDGTAVRFLNREGWRWTLDEVPLPPPAPAPAIIPPSPLPPSPPAPPLPPSPTPVVPLTVAATPTAPAPVPAPVPMIAPLPAPATVALTEVQPSMPGAPAPAGTESPAPFQPAPPAVPSAALPTAPGSPEPPAVVASPPPPPQPPPPPLPPPAPPELPPAVSVQPNILSVQPYSAWDHLFVPQLHALNMTDLGRDGELWGAVLDGGDHLSLHRWLIFGYLQLQPSTSLFSGGAGYSNQQLAPFTISVFAAQFSWRDVPVQPAGGPPITNSDFTLSKRQRDANLSISRLFYENPVALSFVLTEDDQPNDIEIPVARRRLVGPTFFASYTGVESTPYSDDRRLLDGAAAVAVFPQSWGTLGFTVVDLRGQADVTLPLPLSRRHTFHLGLRGRELAGAPDSAPILQVGGAAAGFIYHHSDRPPTPDFPTDGVPPGISFFEPLRGYEDFALATDRVAIADASYRYPLIIDWGTASTLALLPSFFLRQLNFELFFSGAVTGGAGSGSTVAQHAAAGAALTVDFAMLGQWSAQYQFAQRLEDDRARVSAIFLGMGW